MQSINWDEFPKETKLKCQAIADEVEKLGWPRVAIKEYAGSYSFKANIGGKDKTVAKLIPQPPCSDPDIYAGFSPLLPEPENHACKLNMCAENYVIMHEPFCTSRIPGDFDEHRVAEVIIEFLQQGKPRRGRGFNL